MKFNVESKWMQREKRAIPDDLFYDSNDFWIKVAEEAVIGLTDYGQGNIGDIIYLELAPAGTVVGRGDRCGSIESGKWVGSLLAPVSGVIVEANREAEADPRQVNADPFGRGWLYRMELANRNEIGLLMDSGAYQAWVEERIRLEEKNSQEWID
ncbi:MAG: glycine cleavage system protein GcvH [Deltaproteobacteria bacterium]|nr:MAG: glycine cleavage system protein GcvH [Deltaproteobacteria bacterium]